MNTEGSQEILQHLFQQGKGFLETVGHFITGYRDVLTVIFGVGCLPLGIRFFWWWVQQKRKQQKPLDTFPFDPIKPQSNVLKAMFTGEEHDPLADYRIPYQDRVPGRSIQDELKQKLDEHRWVLILAPTGMGKTREAANLAQRLNAEGWTVLKLKRGEWLEKPSSFPEDKIGTDRKLLFMLDDLNSKMRGGETEQSPRMDDPLQPIHQPLQVRLLETLEFYEHQCGKSEIRVLATARNEQEQEYTDEPSPWEKLKFERYDLWKRFEIYQLDAPEDEAIVNLLKDILPRVNIQANVDDYFPIVQRNDRTFSNIIQNLRSLREDGQPLALNTFRDTPKGTWQDRYKKAIEKYPVACYIYDAIELLRELGVSLDRLTVIPAAQLIAGDNFWQSIWTWRRRQQISIALNDLIKTGILEPRDGQIEAKGKRIEVERYIPILSRKLLKLTDRYPQDMLNSLFNFGIQAASRNRHSEALASFNKLLKFVPNSDIVWLQKGDTLCNLGRVEEAIKAFEEAIRIKEDSYQAWNDRGVALSSLKRYKEAIDSYNKAIDFNPDMYQVWDNKGIALSALGHHSKAIFCYDKAIEIEADDYEVWNNKGIALSVLERHEEAIASYGKAINLKPTDYRAWNHRGNALSILGRYQEAIGDYDKTVELKPDFYEAWNDRGVSLFALGFAEEAIKSYDRAIKLEPNKHEMWINRGVALFALGRKQEAIESYDEAIKLK